MKIPVYIINLARSTERFEAVSAHAKAIALNYQRINAIDGVSIDINNCPTISETRFKLCHGKNILPGEAGCYLSHLDALKIVTEGNEPYAIIVEDDVVFPANFTKNITDICSINGWDIIKLANHRHKFFNKYMDVNSHVSIGRFLHGPLGSSAAYIITRAGAAKLLDRLTPMYLPFDVALERGWSGYQIFSTNKNLIEYGAASESTITQGRTSYKKSRLPVWKRIGTLFFRISDYIRRVIYSLMPAHLKKHHDNNYPGKQPTN